MAEGSSHCRHVPGLSAGHPAQHEVDKCACGRRIPRKTMRFQPSMWLSTEARLCFVLRSLRCSNVVPSSTREVCNLGSRSWAGRAGSVDLFAIACLTTSRCPTRPDLRRAVSLLDVHTVVRLHTRASRITRWCATPRMETCRIWGYPDLVSASEPGWLGQVNHLVRCITAWRLTPSPLKTPMRSGVDDQDPRQPRTELTEQRSVAPQDAAATNPAF